MRFAFRALLILTIFSAGCFQGPTELGPDAGVASSGSTSTASSGGTGSATSSTSGSTGSSSTGTSTGGTSGTSGAQDAGPCSDPSARLEFYSAPSALSLSGAFGPTSAPLTVTAFADQDGLAVRLPGCEVRFFEAASDPAALVAFDTQDAITDANGMATVDVMPFGIPRGLATVVASMVGAPTATASVGIEVNDVPDGGGGPCGNLTGASIVLDSPGQPISVEVGSPVTLAFHALDANGIPVPSCGVVFSIGAATPALSIEAESSATDSFGNFSITLMSGAQTGSNSVTADMNGVTLTVPITIVEPLDAGSVVDAGPPVPSQLLYVTGTPADHTLDVVDTQSGDMVFEVLDQYGQPVPNVTVDFAIVGSPLVSLINTSAISGQDGKVAVDFSAGVSPGSTAVQASLPGTGLTNTQAISVRPGPPSWKNFQFYCDALNLPIYTNVSNTITTTCHVQLGDRFGNGVDRMPTVSFFSESGVFSLGSVQVGSTGAADVSFIASGPPRDVAPLAANPAQYPAALANDEPWSANGSLITNPRDQLVTLIAVTRGEEDYDQDTQTFVDLSDPFIDADDDNVASPGETRICATPYVDGGCAPFSSGNGVWDTSTTIWVERHMVFSGVPKVSLASTSGATSQLPDCLAEGATASVPLYAYDEFLNAPASGTTFSLIGDGGVGASLSSSSVANDSTGSIAFNITTSGLHRVAASDGGACDLANGSACVSRFELEGFGTGFELPLTLTNTNAGGPSDGGARTCIPASVTVAAQAPNGASSTQIFTLTVAQ